MKRFTVAVDKFWNVTISSEGRPLGAARTLGSVADASDRWRYPLPSQPFSVPAAEQNLKYYRLCAGAATELDAVYNGLRDKKREDKDEGAVEQFGRYLFSTLLGKENWQEILKAANGEREIELALRWADDDRSLHRLNWEMLCAPNGFLGASKDGFRADELPDQPPVHVAITRRSTAAAALPELNFPASVLFVAETTLTDEHIRPAAEYLNLMQQLPVEGRTLVPRVLLKASLDKLKLAVERFKPDVLYFACHGGANSSGGFIELQGNPNDRDPVIKVYARALLDAIGAGGRYPPVVILSACETATIAGDTPQLLSVEKVAPLASALVAQGVPVVVAMAGRVSDNTCQLFARRFGASLVRGEPFIRATMFGRHAAAVYDELAPKNSPDWALPTIYLADNVPSDYRAFDPAATQALDAREQRVRDYGISDAKPAFYGRFDFFEAMNEILHPPEDTRASHKTVLAGYVDESAPEGIGRTRLLKELAILALRDGHVPVLIGQKFMNEWESPNDALGFAHLVMLGLGNARNYLGVDASTNSPLVALEIMRERLRIPADQPLSAATRDDIKQEHAFGAEMQQALLMRQWTSAARLAMQAELLQLVKDARAKHPDIEQSRGRAILFLDDVESYGDALLDVLLPSGRVGLIGPNGLGSGNEPLPVVMLFTLQGVAKTGLSALKNSANVQSYVQLLQLSPFDAASGEPLLACGRVLLNPPYIIPINRKLKTDKPVTFDDNADERAKQSVQDFLLGLTLPIHLTDTFFYAYIRSQLLAKSYIVEAADEQRISDELKL